MVSPDLIACTYPYALSHGTPKFSVTLHSFA
jgi:hypothetical protein